MRKFSRSDGFTLTELVVVLSILAIVLALGMSGCFGTVPRVQAQEAEVKANIHTIQIALERYMTDNNEYPHYLLGGDKQGWDEWYIDHGHTNDRIMENDRVSSNINVRDALIQCNYMSSYPWNPFTDDPRSLISRTCLAGTDKLGDGDPRFGFKGNLMGQGLDDMNFFRGGNHPGPFFWSQVETRRTLDRGNWMFVPSEFKTCHPIETNMYYLFGGMRAPGDDEIVKTWWPGNFFYKATSDESIGGGMIAVPNTNIGGHYNRYILGGYGDLETEGIDLIRLVYFNPDGDRLSWRCPEQFGDKCFDLGYELFRGNFGESGGLPEVFGGGDEWNGPYIPYDRGTGKADEFIYGSPDGIPDGVILVLTNGSEVGSEF